MLYTIASDHWSADRPLTPSQTKVGLFRTRDEARAVAEAKPTLAVAVRYDPTRGTVVAAEPAADRLACRGWSAPAFLNDNGGVVALCPIPPGLVRQVGPPRLRLHRAEGTAVPEPAFRVDADAPAPQPVAGRIRPGR